VVLEKDVLHETFAQMVLSGSDDKPPVEEVVAEEATEEAKEESTAVVVVREVAAILEKHWLLPGGGGAGASMVVVLGAKVPVLKLEGITSPNGTKVAADICLSNSLAQHNTQLLKTYATIFDDQRVPLLCKAVKLWAKRRGVNDAHAGSLSSYAWVLMVVFYLQVMPYPPVLPCLQARSLVQPVNVTVEGRHGPQTYDVSYCTHAGQVRRLAVILASHASSHTPLALLGSRPASADDTLEVEEPECATTYPWPDKHTVCGAATQWLLPLLRLRV
jgi:hypothetical protein